MGVGDGVTILVLEVEIGGQHVVDRGGESIPEAAHRPTEHMFVKVRRAPDGTPEIGAGFVAGGARGPEGGAVDSPEGQGLPGSACVTGPEDRGTS